MIDMRKSCTCALHSPGTNKIRQLLKSTKNGNHRVQRVVNRRHIVTSTFCSYISNNLIDNKQFGFIKGRSTTDASVELISHIFHACKVSRDAIGTFCSFSKAFDCVHHETLIEEIKPLWY